MHYFPCVIARPNRQYHSSRFLPGKMSPSLFLLFKRGSPSEVSVSLVTAQLDHLWSLKVLNVISAEYFTMKLPEAGIRLTASTNHTQVTDSVEMGA